MSDVNSTNIGNAGNVKEISIDGNVLTFTVCENQVDVKYRLRYAVPSKLHEDVPSLRALSESNTELLLG